MTAHLDQLRAGLADGEPSTRAELAVRLAEETPIFGNHLEPVRALIHAAGPLVEAAADPALEARLLFRLAAIKLAELDWSATDAVLSSAG